MTLDYIKLGTAIHIANLVLIASSFLWTFLGLRLVQDRFVEDLGLCGLHLDSYKINRFSTAVLWSGAASILLLLRRQKQKGPRMDSEIVRLLFWHALGDAGHGLGHVALQADYDANNYPPQDSGVILVLIQALPLALLALYPYGRGEIDSRVPHKVVVGGAYVTGILTGTLPLTVQQHLILTWVVGSGFVSQVFLRKEKKNSPTFVMIALYNSINPITLVVESVACSSMEPIGSHSFSDFCLATGGVVLFFVTSRMAPTVDGQSEKTM